MKINELLDFNINFCGKTVLNGSWERFKWNIEINGEFFEYHTGIGHCTFLYNRKPKDIKTIRTDNEWVHVPNINNILNAILLDGEALNESFYDWCDNLGYESDSRKALDVYESCMLNGRKLQSALSINYNKIKDYINNLEL